MYLACPRAGARDRESHTNPYVALARAREMGMAKVIISGASDDLIEIEGDLQEEFSHYWRDGDDKPLYLAFGDGTLVSVRYDADGCWRFVCVVHGSADLIKVEATGTEDDYTDRITLIGNIHWVVCGQQQVR